MRSSLGCTQRVCRQCEVGLPWGAESSVNIEYCWWNLLKLVFILQLAGNVMLCGPDHVRQNITNIVEICSKECVYQILKIKIFWISALVHQYLMLPSLFSNYVAHFVLYWLISLGKFITKKSDCKLQEWSYLSLDSKQLAMYVNWMNDEWIEMKLFFFHNTSTRKPFSVWLFYIAALPYRCILHPTSPLLLCSSSSSIFQCVGFTWCLSLKF